MIQTVFKLIKHIWFYLFLKRYQQYYFVTVVLYVYFTYFGYIPTGDYYVTNSLQTAYDDKIFLLSLISLVYKQFYKQIIMIRFLIRSYLFYTQTGLFCNKVLKCLTAYLCYKTVQQTYTVLKYIYYIDVSTFKHNKQGVYKTIKGLFKQSLRILVEWFYQTLMAFNKALNCLQQTNSNSWFGENNRLSKYHNVKQTRPPLELTSNKLILHCWPFCR